MSITTKEYNVLYGQIENEGILVKKDYLYFILNNGLFNSICRVPIKKQVMFILNKDRNHVTENEEIFEEHLERKRKGIRGYKTIKMGVIEEHYYLGTPEYSAIGTDIDGYYWMIDWNRNTVAIPRDLQDKMIQYVKGLSSDFKQVS